MGTHFESAQRDVSRNRDTVLEDELHTTGVAGTTVVSQDIVLAAVIGGTSGNDLRNGTSAADTINGLGGNDTLNGLGGNDTLNGGSGNDKLDGGSGADSMVGGTGNDSYVVQHAGDKVVENSGGGTDTVTSFLTSSTFTLPSNVENLILGGSGNLNGIGNSLANILTGNSGNNTLIGGAGNDSIVGGNGNDLLSGGTGDDTLNGGSGNDTLDGGGNADSMIGGSGNDSYVVNHASDKVVETSSTGGIDTVTTFLGSSVFTLPSNVENLILGGSGNISGNGNSLNNEMTGNAGNNKLTGGGGDDIIDGLGGSDTLDGGSGNDVLSASDGPDFEGDTGSNILIGGTGDDTLHGSEFHPDTLIGGAGDDFLFGGFADGGPDTFVFSLATPFGADLLHDLDGLILHFEDVLDADGNSVLNLDDLNAAIESVTDDGPGINATILFKNGSSIDWLEGGDGNTDSIDDLFNPATQIIISG